MREAMLPVFGMSFVLAFNVFLYIEFGLKTALISLSVFLLISSVKILRVFLRGVTND